MTEIEKVKAEIKMLEKKLSFLEELERTKTPCEEAFRRVYNVYPKGRENGVWTISDEDTWIGFQNGYNAASQDYKVGEYQEPEKSKINDLAEKLLPDDHPYKIADEHGETNPYKQGLNMIKKDKETEELMTSKGYEKNSAGFWEPKPQTHEEVSDGLKEAFREVVEQGVIPPVEKKQKTLTDLIERWWCDVFTIHSDWNMETSIDDLVDRIQLWLPKEQSAKGSQNAYVECSVDGFNDCLNKIKGNLR